MINLKRAGALSVAALLVAGMVSGCATTGGGSDGIAANDQPGQLAPVEDSSVSSNSLPPIGGANDSTQVANAGPDQAALPPPSGAAANTGDPGLTTGSTGGQPGGSASQGSFVSLNDVGSVPNGQGRDLSGGLTMQKLLGGWTVVSGATQCRLNLTYTAMTGTSRYRASAPGCQMPALASVSSWQLSGTQLQLFDDSNAIVGALLLSGGRFIGTLAGGQAISMTG
ncbi:MAG TPA: AprI/Inh family metalloprotease inhibitor [Devosiaceae bacterium]|nr:AprI/Inh family metalloprotease inhibitor [Devosiaceae bacterium]